jgi:hypothetical protein
MIMKAKQPIRKPRGICLLLSLAVIYFSLPENSSQALTLEKDPVTLTQTAPRPVAKDEKRGPSELPATPAYRLPGKFDKFLSKGPLNLADKSDDTADKLKAKKEKNWWRRFFHFF